MKKILFLLSILCITSNLTAQTQPNIIFVVFDDMNDWVQGFSGHPQSSTPAIKWVENRGTTFINAYTSAPQCAPSRTSFITGKDLAYTKVYFNQQLSCNNFRESFNEANENETVFTLPEILKDSGGYFTYSIGKIMHCHEDFPDYDSITTTDDCERQLSWSKIYAADDEGGDLPVIIDYGDDHNMGVSGFSYAVIPDSLADETTDYLSADKAIEFINDYAGHPENYCNKPFFLGVGFRRPHNPNYIPESYWSAYYNEDYYAIPYDLPFDAPAGAPYNGIVMPPQPDTIWEDYYNLPSGGVARALVDESPVDQKVLIWAYNEIAENGYPHIADGLTDEERKFNLEQSKRANMVMSYLASIKFADAQLNRIISALQGQPEILNNTIIVVISDHGYSLGEKKHWKKATLWETDIRVPLVIADLRTPAKKTCKRFVSLLDLFPTICEYAGVEMPVFPDGNQYLDGYSFKSLVTDPATPWSKPIITSFINGQDPGDQGSCFPHYSVRDDEWHYITYQTNGDSYPTGCDEATSEIEEELYHIGKKKNIDPYEWNNLADDPAYTSTKEYLKTFLPGGENYLQFDRLNEMGSDEPDNEIPSVTLHPIPANDHIIFTIQAAAGVSEIIISDILGRIVSENIISIPDDGFIQYIYQLTSLPAGNYIATVRQGEFEQHSQFMILR